MRNSQAPKGRTRQVKEVVDDLEEALLGDILGILAAAQAGSDKAVDPGKVELVERCERVVLTRLRRFDDRVFVEFGNELLDRESRHVSPLGQRRGLCVRYASFKKVGSNLPSYQ